MTTTAGVMAELEAMGMEPETAGRMVERGVAVIRTEILMRVVSLNGKRYYGEVTGTAFTIKPGDVLELAPASDPET